jgi:hypothetical protein
VRDADVPPTWVAWSLDRGPAFERDTRCSIEHRPSRGERRQPRLDEWVLFYTADERHQAMRQWAHGDHHTEAGVELLITHGVWPERLDSAGFLSVTQGRIRPGRAIGDLARPDLLGALADLASGTGRLRARSSEHRILALAASLTDGYEVSLSWALDLLTPEQSSAVLAIFARALPYAYR